MVSLTACLPARAAPPWLAGKVNRGARGVPVSFCGATILDGDWLYADSGAWGAQGVGCGATAARARMGK